MKLRLVASAALLLAGLIVAGCSCSPSDPGPKGIPQPNGDPTANGLNVESPEEAAKLTRSTEPFSQIDTKEFKLGNLIIPRGEITATSDNGQGKVRYGVGPDHNAEVGQKIKVTGHPTAAYNVEQQVTAVGDETIDTDLTFVASAAPPSSAVPDQEEPASNPKAVGGKPPAPEKKEAAPPQWSVVPFQPPATLGDLNKELAAKGVKWKKMPVEDSLELLRKRLEKEPPQISVEEALKMRNTTAETNAKILSALQQQPKSADEVDWESEIVRHTAADVSSLNPILASSTSEFEVTGLTSFALFSFDWNFNRFASKEAVVSWEQSDDRMVDKVVMRRDLTWSDGKPMTAHDIVFSWKAIMSSRVPVPAQRSGTDKLKWVEAYGDYTVVYFHKEPLAINHWNVQFSILPKHLYEQTIAADPRLTESEKNVELENNPVVGGAYEVVNRTRNQEIVLQARESYYMHEGKQVRDRPFFDKVRFIIIPDPSVALLYLNKGEIDEKILTPEEWVTKTSGDDFYRKNTRAYGVEWVNFQFNWNTKRPFFSDARVRRAMSLAFDHQELLDKLRFKLDQPCRGIFHPDSPYYPKTPPKHDYNTRDVKEAERLLTEAGWVDSDNDGIRDKEIDGKRIPFDFTILVMNRQDRIDICNLLKRSLTQVGVNVYVSPIEFTVLQERLLTHKFDASMGGWGTGAYPDTSENIWKTGEQRNFGEYSNPEVDRLFVKAQKSLDDNERNRIFQQIHAILYEDQPYTWLYYQNAYYGFNKKLRGYVFSPRGPYNYGPGFSSIWAPAQ